MSNCNPLRARRAVVFASFILAAATCLAAVVPAARADGPRRYAVVIGINEYADKDIPPLKYAEADAKSVFDTLTDPAIGNFPKENVKLILGKEATNDRIKEALATLRTVNKEDLVVIFYSGHGAKQGEEAFWVTQAAKAKMLDATALSNTDIVKFLKQIPSERLVVLLDCCYAASTVKKSLSDPAKLFGEFSGKGRVTIAGAAEKQEALEFPEKKAGVFTYYLVEGLRGAADTNSDGVVTFEELWAYLGDNVRKAAVTQGGLHEPVIITDGATPQFLLTFNPSAKAAASKQITALRDLFDKSQITGAQFDAGRKALSEPALEASARALREVFSDLAEGRLAPKYLQAALDKLQQAAAVPTPPPAGTDPNVRGKPRIAIVPFTEYGGAKGKDLGSIVAEKLLPLFAQDYELVNQMQLAAFLKQDDLTVADLVELAGKPAAKGLTKAVKLRSVQFLIVGSISGPPDGSLSVTASISDWQTGGIEGGRVAQAAGADWKELEGRLPSLAGKLLGRADAAPDVLIEVKAPFAGHVSEVSSRDGMKVRKGQALGKLEDRSLQFDLNVAKSESDAAVVRRDQAKKDAGRAADLVRASAGSKADLDAANAALAKASAEADAAEAKLANARDLVEQAFFRSPVDGTVGKVSFEAGEMVTAGQVLVTIKADAKSAAKGRLEFRVAPFAEGEGKAIGLPRMPAYYVMRLADHGPNAEGSFTWLPVQGDANQFPNLVTADYKGKSHVLVSSDPNFAMLTPTGPADAWGLKAASAQMDERNGPYISVEFDEKGAKRFTALTGASIGCALAIVVDGEVISAPVIRTQMGGSAMITGHYTRAEAEALAKALRAGMPPAAHP